MHTYISKLHCRADHHLWRRATSTRHASAIRHSSMICTFWSHWRRREISSSRADATCGCSPW